MRGASRDDRAGGGVGWNATMDGALVGALALAVALLGAPCRADAQDGYEIQVYPSALVALRATMFEIHSNVTPRGSTVTTDCTQPTNHAWHETLEITHGFTDWLEVGIYEFSSLRTGDGWQWVGTHVRPRVSVPERWKWPVGVSLSQEIGYQRRYFSADTWTWEIRPIIDQRLGRIYWAVNVALVKTLSGEHVHDGWDVGPTGKISVDLTEKIACGLEVLRRLREQSPVRALAGPGPAAVPLDRPGFLQGVGVQRGTRHRLDAGD